MNEIAPIFRAVSPLSFIFIVLAPLSKSMLAIFKFPASQAIMQKKYLIN